MAMPVTQAAIGLAQTQGDFFAQQGLQFEVGVTRQAIDLETEQFADCFAAGETFDHQGGFGQGGFDPDQARLLGDVRGEKLPQRGHGNTPNE